MLQGYHQYSEGISLWKWRMRSIVEGYHQYSGGLSLVTFCSEWNGVLKDVSISTIMFGFLCKIHVAHSVLPYESVWQIWHGKAFLPAVVIQGIIGQIKLKLCAFTESSFSNLKIAIASKRAMSLRDESYEVQYKKILLFTVNLAVLNISVYWDGLIMK